MAIFEGTKKEFHKYLGPIARNIIQQITKTEKKGNVCEMCGKAVELHAAHIHGEERIQIIAEILNEKFKVEGTDKYRVDVEEFFKIFKGRHLPIKEHFKFLCVPCHKKYDRNEDAKIAQVRNYLKNLSEEERKALIDKL